MVIQEILQHLTDVALQVYSGRAHSYTNTTKQESLNHHLGGSGQWSINFLLNFCLFQGVQLYVCRLCINFQDPCASLLGDITPFFMLLTFISRYVSYLKSYNIILMTVTPYGHVLRTFCLAICFIYIAQLGGCV